MLIIEATIHHLQKQAHTQGKGSVIVTPRDQNLPIDDTLETVATGLLSLYNRSTDSSGTFGRDPNVHVFPQRLQEYVDATLDFQALTETTLNLIASRMEQTALATGGYAFFLRYEEPPNDFLLIAMLKLKAGAGVDETTLSLLPTLNIDLDLLNEAARINITRLANNTEPYLTFIKGTKNRAEVTEYFRAALACDSFTRSADQTRTLIKAADDFVDQRQDLLTEETKKTARHDMRTRLHQCFQQNADEVALATLAAAIHPAAPEEFVEFARQTDDGERRYSFNDRFRPDKTVVRSIRRIESRFGSVRLSFDVADVQAGTVSYDPTQDRLIIQSPPQGLKDEILEHQNNASE